MNEKMVIEAQHRVERAQLVCDSVRRKLDGGSEVVSGDMLAEWENELAAAKAELGKYGPF